jgi:ABC-type polysaccharide/polyol phosphate transport system ATPase subunit
MFTLPKTEPLVHPLCLGANTFGWSSDEAQSFAVLDAYVAAVVLVSHDMNDVRKLAQKAIWLENGFVKMSGPTEQVVAAYEKQ